MPATKLGGNTKKSKQCQKGWSCGFSCISKGKDCKSKVPGQAKTYADWMAGQVKGGALVRSSGAIQGTKSQASKTSKGKYDDPDLPQLDNPTDKDVKAYIKKKAKEAETLTEKDFGALSLRSALTDAGTDDPDMAYLHRGKSIKSTFDYEISRKQKEVTDLDQKINKTKSDTQKQKFEKQKTKLEQSIAEDQKFIKENLGSDDAIKARGKSLIEGSDAQTIKQMFASSSSDDKAGMYAAIKSGGASHSEVINAFDRKKAIEGAIKAAMGGGPEKILGLPKRDLTPEAVKSAYKAAAKKAHPDTGGSKEAFEQVNNAYQTLKQKLNFSDSDDPLIMSLNEYAASIGIVNFADIEIEILPKGTHTSSNGFKLPVSDRDLDDLISSYNPANFQAPLIISHDTKGLSDKELGNSEFSFGIPKALKRVGDRVKAVFDKVAPEFEQWVKDRKLVAVSPSFYLPNSPSNPTPGKLSLRHIAALGKTPPAIKGMQPLQEAFNFSESDEGVVNFNFHVDPETLEFCGDAWVESGMWQRLREWFIGEYDLETADRIIPGYEVGILMERRGFDPVMERLNRIEEKLGLNDSDDYPTYQAMTDTKTIDFEERERQLAERETALLKKELVSFCECDLKGKLTPAIASQDELVSFMAFLASQTEVDFSEDKTESPLQWFKGLLTRLPQQVEFKEVAKGAKPAYQTPENTADFAAESIEEDRQIRAYCQQHGLDADNAANYAEAMTALGILY